MFVASSRALAVSRHPSTAVARSIGARSGTTRPSLRSFQSTSGNTASAASGVPSEAASTAVAAMGAAAAFVAVVTVSPLSSPLGLTSACAGPVIPTSGDVFSVGKITKEPSTGIAFPALCNGMSLAGVGVRIKYVFVKVYAVGTYLDPIAMMAIKKGTPADIEAALLDPTYPRTIRIVMNRGLSVDKFIAAIVEAIQPRLKGKNLELLDEFKKLFPAVDLVEGAEVEMTIRGDTLLLKNSVGGVGSIKSRAFTEAMCDVYYGKDPVSPPMKDDLMKNIPKL
jgi:hypothetical protein